MTLATYTPPTEGIYYNLGTSPSEAWAMAYERGHGPITNSGALVRFKKQRKAEGWRARRVDLTVELI